jgi:hypothetical protein
MPLPREGPAYPAAPLQIGLPRPSLDRNQLRTVGGRRIGTFIDGGASPAPTGLVADVCVATVQGPAVAAAPAERIPAQLHRHDVLTHRWYSLAVSPAADAVTLDPGRNAPNVPSAWRLHVGAAGSRSHGSHPYRSDHPGTPPRSLARQDLSGADDEHGCANPGIGKLAPVPAADDLLSAYGSTGAHRSWAHAGILPGGSFPVARGACWQRAQLRGPPRNVGMTSRWRICEVGAAVTSSTRRRPRSAVILGFP